MRLHRAVIPLAAFCAILPLLLKGPSCGHDFDFHLLNWLEAQTQLAHLQYPRWAYTPAWNAGEPRFIFYPPVSWLLGAALTAVLPFQFVATAFTWLALTLSGFALHRFARPYAPPNAATVAAVFYLLNPYMLFTAYERTAYAELLAAAFIPLLFAAILRPRPTIPGIALPVALLWLTNAPAAVMGSYALALLTLMRLILLIRAKRNKKSASPSSPFPLPSRLALTSILGTILGLSLAAFYIVPAAYERRFVAITMAVIPGMAPADNFLFHHTGLSEDAIAHDAVLHTASLIAIVLLLATLFTLAGAFGTKAGPAPSSLLLPLALLTIVVALLLTPISLPIWTHTPQLAFLQFPWRLLALLTPTLAMSFAIALSRTRYCLLPLLLAAIFIPIAWHIFHQTCDLPDTPRSRAGLYHSNLGTEPTDEYTPTDADPDTLSSDAPPYWLIAPTAPPDSAATGTSRPGPAPNHVAVPGPGTLILNRRQYPLWSVRLNHRLEASHSGRNDGLIAVPLPPGRNTVDLALEYTGDELAGIALSLFAAIALLAATARERIQSRSRKTFRYTRSV